MPKFKFNKLVRDKIVDNQIASGALPKYRILSDAEHKKQLILKVIEEAKEMIQARQEELASEIADVQQALDDFKEKCNLTNKDIAEAQQAKIDKNGAFKKGIFVEYVEVDDNDKWVKYYRSNAKRYPEIK